MDPGGRIRVDNVNGSIAIRTWDRPEVSVEVEKQASSPDYLKQIGVVIASDPHQLTVKATWPHRELGWISWLWNSADEGEVHLTLTVPRSADLQGVSLVNGGISIDGLAGPVHANSVNGSIRATGLGGSASLSTVNGSVHAEFSAVAPGAHLSISTVNGSVDLQVPRDAGASVSASTVNGHIRCDLPMQFAESGLFNRLKGVIGSGGCPIDISTVNGPIHIY